MKLGIIGGTFDPIHIGHLLLGQEALEQLQLDRILFIPAGIPWMKARQKLSDKHHRLNMVREATKNNASFLVSDMEVKREGNSYSSETIEQLSKEHDNTTQLFFIMGSEVLKNFPQWVNPIVILRRCKLTIVTRPGQQNPNLATIQQAFPDELLETVRLPVAQIGISSSELRARVQKGLPITHWVPVGVEQYIQNNGLYRTEET